MVPGNHDKNRKSPPILLRKHLHQIMGEDGNIADSILDNALNTSIDSCKFLFEPFRKYDEFAEKFGSREPLMAKMLSEEKISPFQEKVDKMYWKRELTDNLQGYKLNVYGMNSAFSCDEDDFDYSEKRKDGHKMFLSKFAYKEPRHQSDSINIFMTHHPVAFLANSKEIKKELDKRYQIQFFGHVHRTDSDSDNGAIHIYSGALQPPEGEIKNAEYNPVFNILNIDITKNIDSANTLCVDLDVIAWNGKEFAKDNKKSKPLSLPLERKVLSESAPSCINTSLPDGVIKNDVYMKFINFPMAEDVIDDMNIGTFDDPVAYINKINFLDCIESKGMWVELWTKMKEYES